MNLGKSYLLLLGVIFVGACGGGSSSDEAAPTVPITAPVPVKPTSSAIIADANSYTAEQLKAAASELASTRYTGNKETLDITIETAQKTLNLLGSQGTTTPPMLLNFPFNVLNSKDASGNVDVTIPCLTGGTVTVVGQQNTQQQGNLSMTFAGCSNGANSLGLHGVAAVTINAMTDTTNNFEMYYDNLRYVRDGIPIVISGYIAYVFDDFPIENRYMRTRDIIATVKVQDQSIFLQTTIVIESQSPFERTEMNGDIYLFDEGKLTFNSTNNLGIPPNSGPGRFEINSNNSVIFEFEYPYIRYLQDTDNNGVMDLGTYFADANDIITRNVSSAELVAIADMSRPPASNMPYFSSFEDIFTTQPIVVRPGFYDDPDTPRDELNISYKWYLNGELIPDQNTHVLPARVAFYPNYLLVAMVVSDGINVVESEPLRLVIADSMEEIVVSNMPVNVTAGDALLFNAQLSDPDKPNDRSRPPGALIGAPDGATFNENGDVSWQVPDKLLFSRQTFVFTFATTNLNNNLKQITTFEIDVRSDQVMPLARNSIAIPLNNRSITVGDFTGDGLNEILSTDSRSTVFLLESKLGIDKTIWTYPFKIGKGFIVQVLAVNADNDDALEIVVVSENSISIIYDLDDIAVELISTDDTIRFAQIADTNRDGILDIAYLLTSNNPDNDERLVVRSLTTTSTEIISIPTNGVKEIAFGDVDEDSNLELVTNNGLVYDAFTWQNQWRSDNEFGTSSIFLADVNNNGIDEIVGADVWGSLAIYSAVDQAPLAMLEGVNSCSLTAANVDTDNADEIILGDCQLGNVTAYDLVEDRLEQVWSTSTQNYGSISLISGDSDNDGELEIHWGSGIGSSGSNSFVSVDLNATSATVIERGIAPTLIEVTSYSSAGWANITPDSEKAIFFVPETETDSIGSRLAYMTSSGMLSFSDEVSTNSDNSNKSMTIDFNKDGFGDIFLPVTDFFDGAFGAMQLSNNLIHWRSTSASNTTIGMIRAHDINRDGFDDAMFGDGKSLKIADIFNQTLIATLSTVDVVKDFVTLDVNEQIIIAVAKSNKTMLYLFNGTNFLELSHVEQVCEQLAVFNNDNDQELELLCLANENNISAFKQSLIVYEIDDNTLVEVQKTPLYEDVRAVAIDPSTSTEQKLFLAINVVIETASLKFDENSFIAKATSDAKVIWRSPMLIGSPNDASFKLRKIDNENLEILYATDQMIYWIK